MNENAEYVKSTISTTAYDPFMLGDEQVGEVHWLTQTNSSGQPTYSGLWCCDPCTFEYEFPGDEIFHVLQGSLQIAVTGGDTVQVQEGDIAAFNKGQKSVWTIQRPFKKFFVISNC